MDYEEVDQIINENGFNNEPAFDNVTVAIRDIPDMDGCPLGLYYPATGTVVIPPDGYPSVLLHELGHRYGDYYYGDLSEQFAEKFRTKYQDGYALMYAGRDFSRLPKMGSLFEEGEAGTFAMWTDQPLTPEQIYGLQEYMAAFSLGEPLPRISYDGDTLNINFVKGVDWPVIISGGLAAIAAAGGGALAYAIYKTAQQSPWVIPLVLFGGLAGIVLIGKSAARRARVRG